MNERINRILVISTIFVLGFAMDAFSQLSRFGPIHPVNGFPRWYQDSPAGPLDVPRRLRLCLTDLICEFDAPVPARPFSQVIGFGREAFYWGATADIGQLATFEMGVRAVWTGGIVINGNQRVQNFIRIDLRNVPDGTYTVVHPFGRETIVLAPGQANIDFVRSAGGENFNAALSGPVTRFLRGANPAPGFLGDNRVLQRITGSPTGRNFFRIIGPAGVDLGGPPAQINVVTQRLFRIQGDLLP